MVFRFYVVLLLVSAISLLTPLWGFGFFVLPFLVFIALPTTFFHYRKWKKQLRPTKKSLSFGIISMETQKQNFKAINFVFAKSPLLQRFFKKMSIAFDGVAWYQTQTSESCSSRSSYNYRYNPAYKFMSCNVHRRK